MSLLHQEQEEWHKIPKKLDTRLDDDKKVLLEQFLDERLSTRNTDVDELRVVLQNAAAHVFGKKKKVQNDWLDDQDDAIQKLLQDKNMDRHVLRKHIRLSAKVYKNHQEAIYRCTGQTYS